MTTAQYYHWFLIKWERNYIVSCDLNLGGLGRTTYWLVSEI